MEGSWTKRIDDAALTAQALADPVGKAAFTISVEDDLVIEVVDDGVGRADMAAGTGLGNLRRRAGDVTGSFTIGDADGDVPGTQLIWTAPLP